MFLVKHIKIRCNLVYIGQFITNILLFFVVAVHISLIFLGHFDDFAYLCAKINI